MKKIISFDDHVNKLSFLEKYEIQIEIIRRRKANYIFLLYSRNSDTYIVIEDNNDPVIIDKNTFLMLCKHQDFYTIN